MGIASSHKTDFGSGSVTKAVLTTSAPLIVAELVNLLYSQVDRLFISRMEGVGATALTGVGLCLPIISLISAFSRLYGSNGGGPLCAMELGRGDKAQAERTLGTSLTLALATSVVLTVVCLVFAEPMLRLFGASDATAPYAVSYLRVYCLGTIPTVLCLTLTSFVNALGYSQVGMVAVVTGACLNIVLDPLLIFGAGMGVAGAALASALSQSVSCVIVVKFLRREDHPIKLRLGMFDNAKALRICGLGTSGFTMGATNSLVQLVCNKCAFIWGGDLYVGVMTILNSVREIFSTPANGISSGAGPVMSFNYGRGDGKRVMKASDILLVSNILYTGLIWLLVNSFPDFFIGLFTDDPALMGAARHALRIYFFGFVFMSFQFSGQQTFVSLGKARQAVFFSLLRKVIIVVPLTIALPYFFGVDGVVAAEPISNVAGGLAAYLSMRFTMFPMLRKLEPVAPKAQRGLP